MVYYAQEELKQDAGVYKKVIQATDITCCIWFTVELLTRFTVCPSKLQFFKQILNWIDIISVIPYYLTFGYMGGGTFEPVVVELLSILRLLRLFRFFRLSMGLQILKQTMIASSKELLLLLLLLTIPVAIFATVVYYCERKVREFF